MCRVLGRRSFVSVTVRVTSAAPSNMAPFVADRCYCADEGFHGSKINTAHSSLHEERLSQLRRDTGYASVHPRKWQCGHFEKAGWSMSRGFEQSCGVRPDQRGHLRDFISEADVMMRNEQPGSDGGIVTQLITCDVVNQTLLCGSNLMRAGVSAPPRPNIFVITAEHVSPHFGCYGDKLAHTPTLDRLSAESLLRSTQSP